MILMFVLFSVLAKRELTDKIKESIYDRMIHAWNHDVIIAYTLLDNSNTTIVSDATNSTTSNNNSMDNSQFTLNRANILVQEKHFSNAVVLVQDLINHHGNIEFTSNNNNNNNNNNNINTRHNKRSNNTNNKSNNNNNNNNNTITPLGNSNSVIKQIPFEHWIESVNTLHIMYHAMPKLRVKTVRGEWNESTCGGSILKTCTWFMNPQYVLRLSTPCKVMIHLQQEDLRFRHFKSPKQYFNKTRDTQYAEYSIGICIIKQEDPNSKFKAIIPKHIHQPVFLANSNTYHYSRDVVCECDVNELEANQNYLVIPSTLHTNQLRSFRMVFYVDNEPLKECLHVSEAQVQDNSEIITSQWHRQQINCTFASTTWLNNPQFRLLYEHYADSTSTNTSFNSAAMGGTNNNGGKSPMGSPRSYNFATGNASSGMMLSATKLHPHMSTSFNSGESAELSEDSVQIILLVQDKMSVCVHVVISESDVITSIDDIKEVISCTPMTSALIVQLDSIILPKLRGKQRVVIIPSMEMDPTNLKDDSKIPFTLVVSSQTAKLMLRQSKQ